MTILQIRTFPDPILRAKAKPIREFNDNVKILTHNMVETLVEAKGLGLAANQVGVLKRIIVLNLPEKEPIGLINPVIIKKQGVREVEEGCLSFPRYTGLVERSLKIQAKALDHHGGKLYFDSEELFAQILEHEIDHLNGIMFIDHLKKHEKLRSQQSTPSEEVHGHDLNVEIEVIKEEQIGCDSEWQYNEKLYSEIKIEKMLEALGKGNLLVDLSSSNPKSENENLVGKL